MDSHTESHLTTGGDDPFLPKLVHAINHASHIDIAVAFIRSTGLTLLHEVLVDALQRVPTVKLRIITGDYLEITQPAALRRLMLLQELGAEVRVYETEGKKSFHMKAYIFTRDNKVNDGEAFIGSSNISRAALKDGLEWNLRVSQSENKQRFNEISAKYECLFNELRAVALSYEWIEHYQVRFDYRVSSQAKVIVLPNDELEENLPAPTPNLIQLEALAKLKRTRVEGFTRGLVVLATGMGKTWLAAFDSVEMQAKKVLFVAHREEILLQAEDTFLRIKPECRVGRYTGDIKQLDVDYLFASISTLGKTKHLNEFAIEYFDYIIVDEFHHAAARTYQQLLGYFKPKFLLGLTATPERTDQADILALCDDNLVHERDLFFGISSNILSPFDYYGIGDEEVDYSEIPWKNGKFDAGALLNQLATQARANHILKHWKENKQLRTLAFCISKKHADFMAQFFNSKGIKAASVHSESELRRNHAIKKLVTQDIEILFSVDLFNEGVDIPSIDTVLMLRPTESKIIFLQQLGRGLRLSKETNKKKLVVVDFIGNHISFFRKAEALFKLELTNKSRKNFMQNAINESLELPDGCFINYDVTAIDIMKKLIDTRIDSQIEIYRALKLSLGRRPSLAEFYRGGGKVDIVRNEYGHWFELVLSENDFTNDERVCFKEQKEFLSELQTTAMSKSFKMILIEALLALDGFMKPPSVRELSTKSFEILQRKRALLNELPKKFIDIDNLSYSLEKQWLTYWKGNPVKAWLGGNKKSSHIFFAVDADNFVYKPSFSETNRDTFSVLAQELVNYRLMQYEARNNKQIKPIESIFITEERTEIPFFSDLKIACGHFKSSTHDTENIEVKSLPNRYGNLDPAKHFVAQAAGNSMNGGKRAIKDKDYLLLELISPDNAGSISNQTLAIERTDVTGDDQYLLRNVHKIGDGNYELVAQNPEYAAMTTNEEMNTFARLKSVIDIVDFYLHKEFFKHEVAELFELEYREGLWRMAGHVTPKQTADQFLFVNLSKQDAESGYQYHDYFVDPSHFHWQSQNGTKPQSSKGQGIIESNKFGGSIYLFVRKFKKIGGKGAPFIFCGRLKYLEHSGSAPMSVSFELEEPLPEDLFEYFQA